MLIPKVKKIKVFNESGELLSVDMTVTTSNEVIDATTWIKKHNKKKVLLVVHELTRNGVSVVMMHTAILLKKMGYDVLLTALIGGGLEEELKQANIDFISNINIFYRGQQTKEFVTRFDFSIMGTVGIADVVDAISDTNIPIMWWMHESNDENFADFSVPKADNIHYYAGGQRVVECFKKYYHDRKIEKLLYLYNYVHKLNYSIIRLSNPYGPYQRPNGKLGVITTFVYKALKGEKLVVYGDGSVVRDYIFISDAVEGIVRIASSCTEEKIFNLGSGIGTSVNDIISTIKKVLNNSIEVEYIEKRAVDVQVNYLDMSKYKKEIQKFRSLLRTALGRDRNQGRTGQSHWHGYALHHRDHGRRLCKKTETAGG